MEPVPFTASFPSRSAVVVGAGLGGLLAARVLSGHFGRVVVLERDALPAGPDYRSGVPQARHVHVLLAGGLRAMSRLFPGLPEQLAAVGARPVDAAGDWRSYFGSNWLPRFRSGIECLTMSRARLEWYVRQRVEALPNVSILSGCRVTGLRAGRIGRARRDGDPDLRVTGVSVRAATGRDESDIDADLVVDCSGRQSSAPEWLRELGLAVPPETVINAHLGYASRWYEPLAPAGEPQSPVLLMLKAPDVPRGGVVCPVEDGRWVVTLSGTGGVCPPTDEAGFVEFAARAAQPDLAQAIGTARPVTGIFGYRRTENRWRHFERLRRWPEGFIVLGDALCTFNPVYGQGMSVLALSSEALAKWLGGQSDRLRRGKPVVGTHACQRRFKRILGVPWMLATGEDFRWPRTEGARPGAWLRLMHRYMDHVIALASADRCICADFLRVLHLVAKPYILFRPRTLGRVLLRVLAASATSRTSE